MLNVAQLSRIDLNLLVLFQVVLEEQHVARAAHRLHLTPSAVSHGLRRLRTTLQDPLFLRTPRGVVPTERALALRVPISDILVGVQNVIGSTTPFDRATSTRRFVIGAPDAILASTMTPLLKRVAIEAPHVGIGLIQLFPERYEGGRGSPWAMSLARLEKRQLDIAMLPVGRLPPRFGGSELYEEDFVVAMRKGHPYRRAPSEKAFCAAGHLLVSFSGDPYGFVDETLARHGRTRRIVMTVPSFVMALACLEHTELLAVLPRGLVERNARRFGLAYAELPFKRKADPIQAVSTKAAMADPGVAWLVKLLVALHR